MREMNRIQVMMLAATLGFTPPTTDYQYDGLRIDPKGCSCLDCMVGNSIPENQLTPGILFEALAINRPIYDRRGSR